MRSTHAQHRKCYTRLLTSGQSTDLLDSSETRDSECSQVVSVILLDLTREFVLQELHSRHGRVQLVDMMLGKVGNTTSCIVIRVTRIGLERTSKKLDEGGFTRSVRTDDGDSRIELDIDVDVLENDLGGRVAECSFVELEKWRR